MPKATVSTIGFTKTTAEGFFERLLKSGVKRLVDVRLHNTSQLAGFAKSDDLAYFLKKIGGILMAERQIENRLRPEMLDGTCLLCSEATPYHCHRRLVCEYLDDKWNGVLTVRHL